MREPDCEFCSQRCAVYYCQSERIKLCAECDDKVRTHLMDSRKKKAKTPNIHIQKDLTFHICPRPVANASAGSCRFFGGWFGLWF